MASRCIKATIARVAMGPRLTELHRSSISITYPHLLPPVRIPDPFELHVTFPSPNMPFDPPGSSDSSDEDSSDSDDEFSDEDD